VPNVERLEKIKSLAMKGEYETALACLDGLLADEPRNTDVLRLKGNVIELAAYQENYQPGGGPTPKIQEAEKCYQEILKLDSGNVLAMIDLGDHYRNLGNVDLAGSMYDKAIERLAAGHYCLDFVDEAESAYDGKIDIARTRGKDELTLRELEQAQFALISKHLKPTANRS